MSANHGPRHVPNNLLEVDRGQPSEAAVHNMTLRDYFAAAAMTGLCTDGPNQTDPTVWNMDLLAESAYRAADALLAVREVGR